MEFPSHAAWLDFRSPEDDEVALLKNIAALPSIVIHLG